jgi:imidazolonepropionase-like amidohydrolase
MSMKNGTVVLIVFALLMSCATAAPAPPQRVTAPVGGRVLPSPQAAAIADGVVLVEGAAITAVGPRASVRVPEGAMVIDYSTA